jgi:putative thiamine transport system permease protein
MALLLGLATAGVIAAALWSFARSWRFPDAVPAHWRLANWARQLDGLADPFWITLTVAAAAALIALAATLACLENESRRRVAMTGRALWLLYLPLLLPQIGFLFGVQLLLIAGGLDGTWGAVLWSHLLFVLPYVFLALGDHFRALDPRYAQTAVGLGAGPGRVFWRIKLPILLRPVLIAAAVGFAVSVAQYLPTLFAGAGRLATLTTEAVSLATGGDRRVLGIYALAQTLLPWLAFTAAVAVPAWRYRRRRSLQVAQ